MLTDPQVNVDAPNPLRLAEMGFEVVPIEFNFDVDFDNGDLVYDPYTLQFHPDLTDLSYWQVKVPSVLSDRADGWFLVQKAMEVGVYPDRLEELQGFAWFARVTTESKRSICSKAYSGLTVPLEFDLVAYRHDIEHEESQEDEDIDNSCGSMFNDDFLIANEQALWFYLSFFLRPNTRISTERLNAQRDFDRAQRAYGFS